MKYGRINLLIVFLFLQAYYCFSQNLEGKSINRIDSNGLKQGIWVKHITPKIIDTMFYRDNLLNGPYKSYFLKSGNLRHSGEYSMGEIVGVWRYFNLGKLRAEEVERGKNQDSVKDINGKMILPPSYSIVKLYDKEEGYLKSKGRILYFDSWQSDFSNEHGWWIYYNSDGDTLYTRLYDNGRIIKNNAP
jgi:antitoxin component YwqK of YwqJK toxin-antitoxin module